MMGALGTVCSGVVYPKGSIRSARPWLASVLDSTPAAAETEPIALRKSLREAHQEINRLGLVVAEKDAVIKGLLANLEAAK